MSIGHVNPELAEKLPLDRIAELCRKYDVVELSVFGSPLRDDFGPTAISIFWSCFKTTTMGRGWASFAHGGRAECIARPESGSRSDREHRTERELDTEEPVFSIRPR